MNIKTKIKEILNKIVADENVFNVYFYGSLTYGRTNKNSDVDIIVVGEDGYVLNQHHEELSINYYTLSEWQEKAEELSIEFIEMSFLPQRFILKENYEIDFIFDPIKIRKTISARVSNSWSKAHKKMTVEEDKNIYVGKKSLFHCYRILLFGIQLLETKVLTDFSVANFMYDEIVLSESEDWIEFKKIHQPKLNEIKTKFKSLYVEEWRKYQEELTYLKINGII